MSKLTLKTEGDRYVVVTRRFVAPAEAVYRAHTEAKLVQKWMGSGRLDYARVHLRGQTQGQDSIRTMRMTLPDVETRTRMLSSGMERGMEASYVRLEDMI